MIAYVSICSGEIGSGLPNLKMARSADAFTGVTMVESLLLGSGSGVVEATTAVFVMVPVAEGLTVPLIKMVKTAPLVNVPISVGLIQGLNVMPPSVEYSASERSLGTASMRVTSSASEGPALVTTNV
ncbi:hypothetical protein D3C85_1543750 [compost metagenome]